MKLLREFLERLRREDEAEWSRSLESLAEVRELVWEHLPGIKVVMARLPQGMAGRTGFYGWSLETAEADIIEFSSRLWPIMSPELRWDIILHEVAHALLPADVDHGPQWVEKHRALGGSGDPVPEFDGPPSVLLSS